MFGHDDTTTKPNESAEPVEDGTLGSSQSPLTALPPVDSSGSSDTPAAPSAAATPSGAGDFIATDDKGQPDLSAPAVAPAGGELLDIKQQALKQLSPLVGHLNQSAEEKFRTTMMMIQASDDQSLIPTAYDAAKEISDEKTRAQALLDIINEINYFTQHHDHE